jgi:hypothetical protein
MVHFLRPERLHDRPTVPRRRRQGLQPQHHNCSDFSETVIQGSPARQGPRATEARRTEWKDCRLVMSSARYQSMARQIDRPCGHSESAVSSSQSIRGAAAQSDDINEAVNAHGVTPTLELTPAQRSAIYQEVHKDTSKVAPSRFATHVGADVPPTVDLYPLPDDIQANSPETKFYKFTGVDDEVGSAHCQITHQRPSHGRRQPLDRRPPAERDAATMPRAIHSSAPAPLVFEVSPDLVTRFRREARARNLPIRTLLHELLDRVAYEGLTAAILDSETPDDA